MLDPHFVIVGALLSLAGGGAYAVDTLKGKAQPNLVTWVLWSIAPLIAFAAELGKGVGLQSLMTFMVGFMPLIVVMAALISKHTIWKITKFDIVCGLLSILGLGLWFITREGDIAILFAIIADGLAALPTITKSYRHPESENWLGYIGGLISAGITLLTIDHWSFAHYGFPAYILIINSILVILIKFSLGRRLIAK